MMSKLANIIFREVKPVKNIRYISTTSNHAYCQKSQENTLQESGINAPPGYTPVYKFSYIRPLSLINRLKFYQTVVTVVSMPVTVTLNQLNYISTEAMDFTTILGFSSCLTLYSLGYLTTKFVGFIYYNEKTKKAQVSYVDFWGRRKNVEIPADDIVPLSELPVAAFDGLFLTVRRFSTKDTFKLNLRYGEVLDKEKIKRIL